ANSSTGYRSRCAFFGVTEAAVISFPSSLGAMRIRSASSSGNSGTAPRYWARFAPRSRSVAGARSGLAVADRPVGGDCELEEVSLDGRAGACAGPVRGVAVAAAGQKY